MKVQRPNFADGLHLPDGTVIPWEMVKPGKYDLVSSLPQGQRWVVAYIRVSSVSQVEKRSLSQQLEDAWLRAEREGQQLVAVYVDPGRSASKHSFEHRPGIMELLADIRAKRVDLLFVWKRDRITRRHSKGHEWDVFMATAKKHKTDIRFTCPDEPPLGKGAFGRFSEAMASLLSEFESENIRMRVRGSLVARLEKGEWPGGSLPYGFTRNEGEQVVAHEQQALIVREIYRLAHDEGLGCVRIADRINEAFPDSRHGRPWTKFSVEKVLRNRVYTGFLDVCLQGDDDEEPAYYEVELKQFPIVIPLEMWNRVAQMRKERTKKAGSLPTRHLKSPSLLFGLLQCGVCGRPMVGKYNVRRYKKEDGTTSEYRSYYYYCRSGSDRLGCAAKSKGTIRQYLIDDAVVSACHEIFRGVDVQALVNKAADFRIEQQYQVQAQIQAIKDQMRQIASDVKANHRGYLEAKSEKLRMLFRETMESLLKQEEETGSKLLSLEEELQRAGEIHLTEEQVIEALKDWPERFSQASAETQRAMLADVIESVVWYSETRQVDIVYRFDPERRDYPTMICGQKETPGKPGVSFCITTTVAKLTVSQHDRRRGPRSRDVVRKSRWRWEQGNARMGPLPYGFVSRDGRLEVDRSKEPVIHRIMELGRTLCSFHEIAKRIQKEFPQSILGSTWNRKRVSRVLFNPKYCGYQPLDMRTEHSSLDGCILSNIFPVVITPEDWLAMISARRTLKGAWVPRPAEEDARGRMGA